jgi:FtsH-binding integral membrane protein
MITFLVIFIFILTIVSIFLLEEYTTKQWVPFAVSMIGCIIFVCGILLAFHFNRQIVREEMIKHNKIEYHVNDKKEVTTTVTDSSDFVLEIYDFFIKEE